MASPSQPKPDPKPLIAGNWKMNLNYVEATGLVQKVAWTLQDKRWDKARSEVVVLPPFVDLRTVQTLIEGDRIPIGFGAQDISEHDQGAYTGEISGAMLAKLNCSYVVVGHSERRTNFAETDELVSRKAAKALQYGISPIICIGESDEVRSADQQVDFVTTQLANSVAGLTGEQLASCVIAYEPVWAIGSGKSASIADITEMATALHAKLIELVSSKQGEENVPRVLYGGSVKAKNIAEIMAVEHIDGALVGGASLDPEEFAALARFYDLPSL